MRRIDLGRPALSNIRKANRSSGPQLLSRLGRRLDIELVLSSPD